MSSRVPEWRSTGTLAALQELLDVAGSAPEAVARRAGISTSEVHSMRLLSQSPMGPVELARHLGVTSAASSGVVDRLVAHGHAERRPHPADGRRTVVVVTEQGRAAVIGWLLPMFQALAALDQSLSEVERAVVERYLTGAVEALRSLL
ncbi:regulatory protein MarR [Intrasporangium calvum DSM 43043]|uniref:Regulatory protein MarR n=2 Tax=Intrasporangium calvum TaxID=53358 RepID=E6SDY2_INTC7|nr:regulatory protein MarR [Intrasporangium calvum DSM 43043]